MKKSIFIVAMTSLVMCGLTSGIAHAQDASRTQTGVTSKTDYVLFVEVKVKPESVLDFKEALLSIVGPTRDEKGNIAYIAHQSPDDLTDFMVYEHWESDAAHIQHLQSSSFVNYSKLVAPMIQAGYPIRKKMIDLDQD